MLASFLRDDPSLALATDLYELSMAQGYWKSGMAEQQAEYHMFFRQNPFGGGFVVWAGLEHLLEALAGLKFSRGDLDYLSTLKNRAGGGMFEEAFLTYLENFRFTCSVDAVPEGTVVFPNEPLIRVQGSILEAQVVETLLLTIVNYQSLIATKAARMVLAARGDPVFEFGLRRAPGLDGGFSASRAAYIGGCMGTSNVLAGKWLGIQVVGTFAHSWVMSFENESTAFDTFADAMPENCVFLVDTYDSLEGVRKAARVGQRLKEQGHQMAGIRLDSGDLTYLSIQARRILDEAGLPEALVMASGDLDEWLIHSMKTQSAQVNAWGVGTRLVTGNGDPALGGVYKLTAIRPSREEAWRYKLKLSEQKFKTSIPGVLQVYRCTNGEGKFMADAILEEQESPEGISHIIDPNDNTKTRTLKPATHREPLLERYLEGGALVRRVPTLLEVRERAAGQLAKLDPGHKRFENPHIYPVGLSPKLNRLRDEMIASSRALEPQGEA